jgi:imidazolonepropionase-like amidohydrolase
MLGSRFSVLGSCSGSGSVRGSAFGVWGSAFGVRRSGFGVLALALLAAACGGNSSPSEGGENAAAEGSRATRQTLILRNFTLIDGTDRVPSPGSAMVIEDGRIAWLGPNSDVKVPDGAQTRDLTGAFVMPGLINLHGHVGNTIDFTQDRKFHTRESVEKDLRTYASYGVTTVLSMGTDQDTVFGVREAQQGTRPSMARIYTAGQGLMLEGGYGGLAGVNDPVATPEEAAAEVNRQIDKGVDIVKLWLDSELKTMPAMPPAITQAIIDTAHKRDKRVVAHIFYLDDAKRVVEQGVDALVHSVRDRPVDQALIAAMKERGVWQGAATLSREAAMFAYASTPDFASDPFFTRSVSSTTVELIKDPERQKAQAARPFHRQLPAFLDTAKANLKRLADAGVPYGFGTDAGPPGRFPGFSEHWELQLMAEAGLTPHQVIMAATSRAAEFLDATDIGSLQTGKWADLLVLDANPLDNIRNSRTIRAVYVAGNEVAPITQGTN